MGSIFTDMMRASISPGLTLPDAFTATFDWMEKNGHVGRDEVGEPYGRFQPIGKDDIDCCGFHLDSAAELFPEWSGNSDPTLAARLAIIMATGDDGSHAAIWRDDAGRQRFVHIGSGSGSTLVCVLTDNPVDMLRLFAIGYPELCWPEDFDMTPAEVATRNDHPPPPATRSAYADFVARTFGVEIPKKASEIVKKTADMDDKSSDDPFWRWCDSIAR